MCVCLGCWCEYRNGDENGMVVIFFFKQKTAYEMRISDWSSDVCSSDLDGLAEGRTGLIIHRPRDGGSDDGFLNRGPRHRISARMLKLSRSEERRVGKVCVSRCRSRGSTYHENKNTHNNTSQYVRT